MIVIVVVVMAVMMVVGDGDKVVDNKEKILLCFEEK